MNEVYLIKYKVNGEWRSERISAPDMETAERQWKQYRADIPYTAFTIFNPDHLKG